MNVLRIMMKKSLVLIVISFGLAALIVYYTMLDQWREVTNGIIGTFLGVILAFSLDAFIKEKSIHEERKTIKQAIKEEIIEIKKSVDNHKLRDNKYIPIFYIDYIKTPTWDGIVNSLKMSLFSDYSWNKDLHEFYNYVQVYNKWNMLRTESEFLQANNSLQKIDAIDVCIISTGEKITEFFNKTLEKFNKDNLN